MFCPANLKFNPHKRQLPSFPITAGHTDGPRRKYVEEFVTFPGTALKNFTHRAAAAAALSCANRFAKVMLHVTKMTLAVKETLVDARRETRQISLSFLSFFSRCERPLLAGNRRPCGYRESLVNYFFI